MNSGLNTDLRTVKDPVADVCPAETEPEFSEKYINCLAVDDYGCVVCGGGPQVSLWHLGTRLRITQFDVPRNHKPRSLAVHNNKILIGTSNHQVFQFSLSGEALSSTKTQLSSIEAIHPVCRGEYINCVFLGGRGSQLHVYSESLQHVHSFGLFNSGASY